MDGAVEAIHALKYRYLRGLDTQDLDLLGDCLSDEATIAFEDGKYSAEGKGAILDLIGSVLTPAYFSCHLAVHPEVEVEGDHGTGHWKLMTTSLFVEGRIRRLNAGYYHDEYVKQGARWLIAHSGSNLSFSTNQPWTDDGSFECLTFPARGA
jgi:hypothetical protein